MDASALVADLNDPQREAVEYGEGPLLIVAGAGSGKTRVITRRIAHLITRGVQPSSILAITFTRKAAGEMRERVEDLVGGGRVLLSTFHGFCARVLRMDGRAVGLTASFTIYDGADQLTLVREITKGLGLDPQNPHPRALLSAISRRKTDGIGPEEAEAAAISPFDRVVARVYTRYVEGLAAANAVDFDDLLGKTVQLFREHEDVLVRYQQRFSHVLVDEYQDTNAIQDHIARGIAAGTGNLCVTGDPDQSIYRWRGARIRHILDFEHDYPDGHVVRLEQNYRSTNHILAAASAVIANNPSRLMGNLWSNLGDGCKITVQSTDDEEAEADVIVRKIVELRDEGMPLNDIAVFYRTNALSRGFERALRLHNVAYELIGAVEFYERKEVKDLLAYLRVLSNPADALAFLRVVNTPTRGIGRTTLERLRAWAVPRSLSPREAARRAGEIPELNARAKKALAAFTALLDGLETTLDSPPGDTLRAIIERTDYNAYLSDFGGQEANDRLDNVAELEAALAEYVNHEADPTITGFLEETVLLADIDKHDPTADRLTLMTLHSAKGLEFPVVFMAGMEEGLLPHQRSMDNEEEIQEERRLCYVGMTRAMRRLVLSHAGRRAIMGTWMPSAPSRFLEEVPEDHTELDDRTTVFRPTVRRRGRAAESRSEYVPDADDYVDLGAAVGATEGSGEALPVAGQTVRHSHFGQGVVLEVRGSGASARITVRFEHFGEKQLMAEYARLQPVF